MKMFVVALVTLLACGSLAQSNGPTYQTGRLTLLNGGYASYGTGRSVSANRGATYTVAAPAQVQQVAYAVQAAPAVQTYTVQAAAPAVQHVAYAAAPAVQHVAYAAAPAVQHVSYAAAPAVQTVAYQAQAASRGPYQAAIQSTHHVQVYDVPSSGNAEAQSIVIPPSVQPLDVEFQSQSSPLRVSQSHIPGVAAAPQESSHEEEADIVRQSIVKPVVHEVNEVIQPYRRVTQEVKPVLEEVNQIVAQGQRQQVVQAQRVQAAPAIRTIAVQAAPAVQTVAVQAAPAVQHVAYQAAPAVATRTVALASPSVSYGGLSGLSGLTGLSGYTSGAQQLVLLPAGSASNSGSYGYSSGRTILLANGGNYGNYGTAGSRIQYVRK